MATAYVGYVLQRIAPQHYGTIHNGGGSHGPLAVDFYHRFHVLPPAAPAIPPPPAGDPERSTSGTPAPALNFSSAQHDPYNAAPVAIGRIEPLAT